MNVRDAKARAILALFGWLASILIVACRAGEPGAGRQRPAPPNPTPPPTRMEAVVDDYHGTPVADPYRWLEDIASPQTAEWIEDQNETSVPYLAALSARDHFERQLAALDASPDPGELRKQGSSWVLRSSGPDGVALSIRDAPGAPDHTVLTGAQLGLEEGERIDGYRLSPDGRRLAYTATDRGSEFLELRVYDLEAGELLPERISNLKFDMPFWTADSEHIVYWRYATAEDADPLAVDRNSRIAVHRLGDAIDEDLTLSQDTRGVAGVTLWSEVSPDGRLLLLHDAFGGDRQTSVIDLGDPLKPNWKHPPVALSQERQPAHFIGNVGTTVYLRTTRDAPLGRVVAIDLERPDRWQTVVPESEHLLDHALLVGGRIVVTHRRDVISALTVHQLDGTPSHEIELPSPGTTYWTSGTPDHPSFTFSFDGYVTPASLMHHDVHTRTTERLATRVVEALDGTDYVSTRVFYPSTDGTRIPLFLSHRADATGPAPTLLYGYGAAGDVLAPIFRTDFFAWMEAGGVLAVANIRGGGEYGQPWIEAGRLAKKQNTFDDFIAAAEFLIAEGTTSKKQLAILGESNGGLLVGAAMTQRPDLFATALPVVGVLDALRFPTTTAGPRWAATHGDPTRPEQFEWLYSWSPLHRLASGTCYPATLVTASDNDDLVAPSQSYKFAARLQAVHDEIPSCARPALLRVYAGGGHRFSATDSGAVADMLAFAAQHTGLTP